MKQAPIDSLPPPPDAVGHPDAHEIIRVWVVGNGLQVALRPGFKEAGMWGMALVDIARHVIRMYANEGLGLPEIVEGQIKYMWDAEWDRPTDIGVTERHGIQ